MKISYKKRKLEIMLPLETCEEIRQIAQETGWTEEEILVWSLESGMGENENADEIACWIRILKKLQKIMPCFQPKMLL
jgi:hypothetical protein